MPSPLPHQLDRTITIHATPDIVFGFLTNTDRWASWWGEGSTIDARPGGAVRIVYPGGTEALGEIVEVSAPTRIVFTYGYAEGSPIPPGASTVTIDLEPHSRGTRLHLTHAFAEAATRDQHVQGWRYQLALFSNVVTDAANGSVAELVDEWFAAWADPDAARRQQVLERIAVPTVQFRDRYSNTDGLDDLIPHIAAAQKFMPGIRLTRSGTPRHCQGTVLSDWVMRAPDGQDRGRGTNVFTVGSDGRIHSVVGFTTTV